ncbi:MAG: ABC transporter ATP-binding protein [Chloroflexi bacterium]|nr:MAG: ABC transporter ATP-binding protein [Chloroflexota bacterium]HDN80651.1 ABC transporter ATP-binding protein [Chloroflexota bacterium]
MALLELQNVHTYYGYVHALKGISITVEEGEIVTLIGANGAGKTTTLRTISGLIRPKEGKIFFEGKLLNNVPAHKIVYMGISHAPEGRKVFPTLTVEENLNMGAYSLGNDKEAIEANRERVFRLFPRLKERRKQLAGTLSGGEQQMLAIGRALMSRPKLLMLDEPSLGLAPMLVRAIFETIREINEQGVTILLVEQNARAALKLAHRGYVLETGRIVLSGTAQELMEDERVRKAYLGER